MGRALADLSESVRLAPNDLAIQRQVHELRAGLYFHNGDYDRALTDYTVLIGLDANSAAPYEYRGFVYATKGDHVRAIVDYTEAVRLEPSAARVYNQRAWSYLRAGRAAEALPDADRALALDANNATFYSTRGLIHRALGKTDESISDLRKALSLDPANDSIQQELALAASPTRRADGKGTDPAKLALNLQAELKRVGCDPGAVDGQWGKRAQSALQKFASHTKSTLSVTDPTAAALEAVSAQRARVCPLQCDDDETEVKGKCVAKPSKANKVRSAEPSARRQQASPRRSRPESSERPSAGPPAGGSISIGIGRGGVGLGVGF